MWYHCLPAPPMIPTSTNYLLNYIPLHHNPPSSATLNFHLQIRLLHATILSFININMWSIIFLVGISSVSSSWKRCIISHLVQNTCLEHQSSLCPLFTFSNCSTTSLTGTSTGLSSCIIFFCLPEYILLFFLLLVFYCSLCQICYQLCWIF